MLPRDSDRVQGSKLGRSAPCVFRADTPDEFRFAALGSKHAGEKEEISYLNGFDINLKGLRWRWKHGARFRQALLSARRPRDFDWAMCLRACHREISPPPPKEGNWTKV